jgi:hypothetical protein
MGEMVLADDVVKVVRIVERIVVVILGRKVFESLLNTW